MDDVIGGYTEPERFAGFLADWRERLTARTEQAVAAISAIDGVEGLILAGSIGAGQPWPLSDIDLLPIHDARRQTISQGAVEATRLRLVEQWTADGWWTGVDIGRLFFTDAELTRVFRADDPDPLPLLADDRWYHSLDKGFGSRPVYDPHGLAARLAPWFTSHRFDPPVVEARLERARREVETNLDRLWWSINGGDLLAGCTALFYGTKWVPIWWLERWGTRDNSFARVGTRFERLAAERGRAGLATAVNGILGLDEATAGARLAVAPDWVIERRDRQWAARSCIGEAVTPAHNDRDTLRVATQHQLRCVTAPPCPAWLGLPGSIDELRSAADQLRVLAGELTA